MSGKESDGFLKILEIKVIEHCNFRCVACGTFSNIAEKAEYGVDKLFCDLNQLKKLQMKIGCIRLYGGEPLMAENLIDYIRIVKRIYPMTDIEIVTNGFFIIEKQKLFWEEIKEKQVKIVVSYYDEKNVKVKKGIEFLENNNVRCEVIPTRHFYVLQDFSEEHDPELSRRRCVVSIAAYMHNSKLYACPYPFSYVHYDKKYNTTYSCIEDGIDIYSGKIASEILELLRMPMSFCKYCKDVPSYVRWKQCKATQTDWFANKQNKYIDEDYSYYNFLIDVSHLYYVCVDKMGTLCILDEDDMNTANTYIVIYDTKVSLRLVEDTFEKTANKLTLNYSVEKYENLQNIVPEGKEVYVLFLEDLCKKKEVVKRLSSQEKEKNHA